MSTHIVYVIRRRNEKGEVETFTGGNPNVWEVGKLTPKTGAVKYGTLSAAADDTSVEIGEWAAAIRITTKKREKLSEVFEKLARERGGLCKAGEAVAYAYTQCARIAKERGK